MTLWWCTLFTDDRHGNAEEAIILMATEHDIHPDFAKLPGFTLKFGALTLGLINRLSRLQCFFARGKLAVELEDCTIQRPDGSQLKVTVMTPPDLQRPAPVLIYYHGGAFAITYAALHLENCVRYATGAGCVIVFVDYRLAPRYPFPHGFDDCYLALQWTGQVAQARGFDPERIVVGGDSAGGALSAGVAQKARDEASTAVRAQMLIYPVTDHTCSTGSATEFTDVPVFNAHSNRNMWPTYLAESDRADPPLYAAPGHGEVHSLPLTYVETAEFDPLRDEGLAYAARLQAADVQVQVNETLGTVHGYDAMHKSDVSIENIDRRIAFLKSAFS